ncbi:hypothetical protein ACQZV8_17805 [Magnetococcales bacterium HHB-1]
MKCSEQQLRSWWREKLDDLEKGVLPSWEDPYCSNHIVFHPPNGGRFRIKNCTYRFKSFSRDMRNTFKAPTQPKQRSVPLRRSKASADATISRMILDDELPNAANMAWLRKRPLLFARINPICASAALLNEIKPMAGMQILTAKDDYTFKNNNNLAIGYCRRGVSRSGNVLKGWAVVHLGSGLAILDHQILRHTRKEAIDYAVAMLAESSIRTDAPDIPQKKLAEMWFSAMGVEDFDYAIWTKDWGVL